MSLIRTPRGEFSSIRIDSDDDKHQEETLQAILKYEFKEINNFPEEPKLVRSVNKKCLDCINNVSYATFFKCINCIKGIDALQNWHEFYTYAKQKSAHVDKTALMFGQYRRNRRILLKQFFIENPSYLLPPIINIIIIYL